LAKELFILCWPDTAENDLPSQTISLYRALSGALQQEGGSIKNVLQEMVFFRDIHGDLGSFQSMRIHAVPMQSGNTLHAPVTTFIQQPPVNADRKIELLAYAVIPK
jgi:hypothetical protein